MLRTTSKKALNNIRAYIVNNTDSEPYGVPSTDDFKSCCQFLMSAFYQEKVKHDKRRMPYQDLFVEWLSGLPTVFDSCYYYNRDAKDDLSVILEETEEEKNRYTEDQACDFLSHLIWREVYKACGYEIRAFVEV